MHRNPKNKKLKENNLKPPKQAKKRIVVSDIERTYASKRRFDDTWDFKNENTKEFTHCFHAYPAMMIPQVARRILENFGKGANILFDPFCGTGTSLVEANLKGINAIGTDINPLARLIAEAKTAKINVALLNSYLTVFEDFLYSNDFGVERMKHSIIPRVKNIDYWFARSVQHRLALILEFINTIDNPVVNTFFKVAFSETVREVSFVKSGEFKLVRNKDLTKRGETDVFNKMLFKLRRNISGLKDFISCASGGAITRIYDFNSVHTIPAVCIKPSSIDMVLTSPPYGDSRTTVAYGQYSRLANEWLGYEDANQVDNELMGGRKKSPGKKFSSDILNDLIDLIHKEDSDRVKDVVSFFEDYENAIKNISQIVKKNGFVCFVVGNRTVKGVTIPTDEITCELFAKNNFVHIETVVRNIPNKRMPYRNSPTNVAGNTAATMKNEYIVICQKA